MKKLYILFFLLLNSTVLSEVFINNLNGREFVYIVCHGDGNEQDTPEILFTVPAKSKFVFLKVDFPTHGAQVEFYVDNELFLYLKGYESNYLRVYEWIDGSMVLTEGQTLKAIYPYHFTLTGYLVSDCPESDLTGDCKVNFSDLSIMAKEWLAE